MSTAGRGHEPLAPVPGGGHHPTAAPAPNAAPYAARAGSAGTSTGTTSTDGLVSHHRRLPAGVPPHTSTSARTPASASSAAMCASPYAVDSSSARPSSAGPVSVPMPTTSARSPRSQRGARSPSRYGSATTPPAPGG